MCWIFTTLGIFFPNDKAAVRETFKAHSISWRRKFALLCCVRIIVAGCRIGNQWMKVLREGETVRRTREEVPCAKFNVKKECQWKKMLERMRARKKCMANVSQNAKQLLGWWFKGKNLYKKSICGHNIIVSSVSLEGNPNVVPSLCEETYQKIGNPTIENQ